MANDTIVCNYCDEDGRVEMDNNGPIGICPICQGKKQYTRKELSNELIERITTLDYSYNIPVRYIRVMAAELLEYRKKDGDWRSRIPWGMLSPDCKAIAKDENGQQSLYPAIPGKDNGYWCIDNEPWNWMEITGIKLIPDTIPWDESLAIRPGCEVSNE